MASVFKLTHANGTKSYYGSVYIDGKRYRKKLSDTKVRMNRIAEGNDPGYHLQ